MTLEEIIKEVDDGGVFIGEYKDIKKILKNIDDEMTVPFLLIHHKAIELKKNNDNYIINSCKIYDNYEGGKYGDIFYK